MSWQLTQSASSIHTTLLLLTGTIEFGLVQAINTFAAVITQAVLTVPTSPFTLSLWNYLIGVTIINMTCVIMGRDFLYNSIL